jgi:hypothetical protein
MRGGNAIDFHGPAFWTLIVAGGPSLTRPYTEGAPSFDVLALCRRVGDRDTQPSCCCLQRVAHP